MSVKLLTENYLEFLRSKGGCTDAFEPTLVKIPHCWKSYVAAHIYEESGQDKYLTPGYRRLAISTNLSHVLVHIPGFAKQLAQRRLASLRLV